MMTKEQNAVVTNPPLQTVQHAKGLLSVPSANRINVLSHDTINGQYLAHEAYTNTKRLNDLKKTKDIANKVGDVTNTQKTQAYSFPSLLQANKNLFT